MSNMPIDTLLRRVIAILLALPVMVICANAHSGGGSTPVTHAVIIKGMRFNPPQMTVNAGDTVEWKNEDIFAHTVTANDGSFDSGLISPGQSWKTVIEKTGTIAYHCRPHPNMTADLSVSSSATEGAHAGMHSGGTGDNQSGSLRWAPPRLPQEIHPILVNFTAALLPLSLLSDILGRLFGRKSLHNAAWWMVLYAAAITPFTAAAGWWWKHSQKAVGLPVRLITVHQWLGTTAAALFIIVALWRWHFYRRGDTPSAGYLGLALLAVLALVYQGSLGGAMVFGR